MMKKLLLVLLLLIPAQGLAAITFVNHKEANLGQNGNTTGAVDMTGANLFVAVVSIYTSGSQDQVVTSSPSNTWHALTQRNSPGTEAVQLFYAYNATASNAMTFTVAGTNIYTSIAVVGFSGGPTSDPIDQESAGGTSAGGTSIQPGSITPSENDTVVVAGVAWSAAVGTVTVDSGFSTVYQIDVNPGDSEGVAVAYKIQTALGAENPTFSWGAASNAAASQASFKSGGGGGTTTSGAFLRRRRN